MDPERNLNVEGHYFNHITSLYVNKRIAVSLWQANIRKGHLTTLHLTLQRGRKVQIRNIYNPGREKGESSTSQLLKALGKRPYEGDIALWDFNLHHPYGLAQQGKYRCMGGGTDLRPSSVLRGTAS